MTPQRLIYDCIQRGMCLFLLEDDEFMDFLSWWNFNLHCRDIEREFILTAPLCAKIIFMADIKDEQAHQQALIADEEAQGHGDENQPLQKEGTQKRLDSLDIFRGLTVAVIFFHTLFISSFNFGLFYEPRKTKFHFRVD